MNALNRQSKAAALDRQMAILEASEGTALEAHARAGNALREIRDGFLWVARHGSYHDFLRVEAHLSVVRAAQYIEISTKWESLQKGLPQGYPMPTRLTQLLRLSRVPLEHRPSLWLVICETAKKDGDGKVTLGLMDRLIAELLMPVVEKQAAKVREEEIRSLGDARNRIAEVCGDLILRRIDQHKYRVTDKELILWARQTQEQIHCLARALEKLGWSISHTLEELARPIRPDMSIRDLAARSIIQHRPVAIAFGGSTIRAEEVP